MIGAKQFEPEALNKKPPRKIKNPLLEMIRPRGEKKNNEEFSKLDRDLSKIKKEGSRGLKDRGMPSQIEDEEKEKKPRILESFARKPKKEEESDGGEKAAKKKHLSLTEDDINQISYRVFSSVRRYLDRESIRGNNKGQDAARESTRELTRESNKEDEKSKSTRGIKIELSL